MLRDHGSCECLHDTSNVTMQLKAAERCFPNIKNGLGREGGGIRVKEGGSNS